ncbi:nuclear speckle splicing regulatory protein 1-like [Gracilinanus agilis]|uniref:nuclear speckle splicing regulatory protein 1-like n=1 Tax=Gracilinanus agilis TaxID=191870 RepID=UPI001CFCCCFB|nr:nuclear speckle splicing regulatory protein 1-like [Gracilinanus agilis]
MMKQTKLEIQKALAEDATVYEYDSIYDEMQQKKEESNPKLLLVKDRKPKYIHSLLKAVEMRKKEQEKRMEKKIQKEREMEKGEFDDKEAFVTSAYKKKLQERAEEAERERRAAALEACLDVTKEKDLSRFYRHLLNQAVGKEEVPECSLWEVSSRIKEEKPRGYSDELNPDHRVPVNRVITKTRVKEDENPDADSSEDDDKSEDKSRWSHRNERGHHSERNWAHSSSSREDRGHKNWSHTKGSRTVMRKRGDQHQDRSHKSHIREPDRCPESGHHEEKPDQHRSREDSNKDHIYKRREQEDRERRTDLEHRQEEEREKQSSRGQEKARPRNSEELHDEERWETKDRGNGHMERKRYGQEKCRAREPSTRLLEQAQEREESSSRGGASERVPSLKGSQESKRRLEEGGEEKPPETLSKFAKHSNKDSVMSARDRYLARQMARVGAKTYIEKEED